jgi:ferredoxin--NADP+ reductase
MYNPNLIGSTANTESDNRLFVYEVVGLGQSETADNMNYSVRRSGSTFITVPYNRMNQEMQRITRMGGKIVSIRPGSINAATKTPLELETKPKTEPKAKKKAKKRRYSR